MSKNIWQIRKQSEQFSYGKSLTSRINGYTKKWEDRCYSNGIPDEVPEKLTWAGRAPSWKAIAICILSGDHYLSRLGLSRPSSKYAHALQRQHETEDQMDLF